MVEIKRCPFCGGEAELQKGICELDNYVMCLECRSKTKLYNTKESAIEKWNTRKPMQEIVENLKAELLVASLEVELCASDNSLEIDSVKGYANGVASAIETVKEVGGIND